METVQKCTYRLHKASVAGMCSTSYSLKMKLVLVVLATLAVAGSTLAEERGVCTVEPKADTSMHGTLAEMALHCFGNNKSAFERLQHTELTEETPGLIRELCERRPRYRTCLDDVTRQSEICQNETSHQTFLLGIDFVEVLLEAGCKTNSTILASVFNNFGLLPEEVEKDGPVGKCLMSTGDKFQSLAKQSDIEASVKTFAGYNEILAARNCVRDFHQVGTSIDSFLTEIEDRMKCIHPVEKTIVLCKSIEGHGYCPLTVEEGGAQSMDKIIRNHLEKCINDINPEAPDFSEIHDKRGYIVFYRNVCRRSDVAKTCLNYAIVLSGLCLDRPERDAFKVTVQMLLDAVEEGCVLENGAPLAIVTYNILQEGSSPEGHLIPGLECLQVAKAKLLPIQADDVHIMTRTLHRELEALKRCFVKLRHGDNEEVFYVELMLNGMLRKMWCFDYDSNTPILCETLQPTPARTHCPYVLHKSSGPNVFKALSEVCFDVNRADFAIVENVTDLSELQGFFSYYCQGHTQVTSCLKDVDSDGKVCLLDHEYHLMHTLIDMMRNFVMSGCENDGNALASYVYGMEKFSDVLKPCTAAAKDRLMNIADNAGNSSIATVDAFKTVTDFTECYARNVPGEEQFKTDSVSLLRLALKKLHCVSNEGVKVACESIVGDANTA